MTKSSNRNVTKTRATGRTKSKARTKATAKTQRAVSVGYGTRSFDCPYTGKRITIKRATLGDLNNKSTFQANRKRLWTIAAPAVRNEAYTRAAVAIAEWEQSLIPSYGKRTWDVAVSVSESASNALFRAYKGRMELAVLPHLLERIPAPPRWPGCLSRKTEQWEENYRNTGGTERGVHLLGLEASDLSKCAWQHLRHEYHIPAFTVRWKSPDCRSFTSRKSAWDYAQSLCQKEMMINRFLHGIGSSGKLLQPFVPTVPQCLKVGTLRFERDGLWVVGQELAWQDTRQEELDQAAQTNRQSEPDFVETASPDVPPPSDTPNSIVTPKRTYTALTAYIATNRRAEQDASPVAISCSEAEIVLRQKWKGLSEEERDLWKERAVSMNVDANKAVPQPTWNAAHKCRKLTALQYYIQSRRCDYRDEQMVHAPDGARMMTLGEAESELRAVWKVLPESEHREWQRRTEAAVAKLSQLQSKDADNESDRLVAGCLVQDLEVVGSLAVSRTTHSDTDIDIKSDGQADARLSGAERKPPCLIIRRISSSIEPSCDGTKYHAPNNSSDCSPTRKSVVQDVFIVTKDDASATPVSQEEAISHTAASSDVVAGSCHHEKLSVVTTSSCSSDRAPAHSGPTAGHGLSDDGECSDGSVAEKSAHAPRSSKEGSKRAPSKAVAGRRTRRNVPPKHRKRWCLDELQIKLCYNAVMEHYESVMRTVKSRDLHRELEDGFDVLRERGRGRYDMELPAFDSDVFSFLNIEEKAPWMPVVKSILGEDAVLIHKGSFMSLPGAETQGYHQDGLHLTKQTQKPCHAVNVFVPLVDLTIRNGPTEFVLGSHVLGQDDYDRDFVETPRVSAGTPIVFDYRLGHRGLGNSSGECRPIVYCTYARAAQGKEFRDSVNFSRKRYRAIGDLVERPLSREERCRKRERKVQECEDRDLELAIQLSKKVCA